MQTGAAVNTELSFPRCITRYQWLVFFVVWAGWTLDAADFGLYSLVLQPALKELMANPTPADIGRVGGLISTAGLLGWAFGGFTFGIIADYIGRVRTLALSILIFSVFTALQGLSQTPLQLGIFRFFAGVGTGAEIIVGIPFVAEVFAEKNRARILGIMMTGGAVGTLLAAQVYNLIGHMGWRWVFYVGIVPALLLVFIRRGMVEPEHFQAVRERRQALAEGRLHHSEDDREFLRFVPLQLFNRQNRFSTLVGLLFCVGTLLAIWTSQIWLPTIQRNILAGEGVQGNDAISYISFGMTMWALGGVFGYASFGFIADAIGRRPTILLYNLGTLLVGLYLYLAVTTFAPYPYILFVFGFFVFGVFSGHAVYLPELFPTHVRATAVSFCNGSGRVITSFGPLLAGLLVGVINLRYATAGMTGFALLSVLAMALGRETRYDELPR